MTERHSVYTGCTRVLIVRVYVDQSTHYNMLITLSNVRGRDIRRTYVDCNQTCDRLLLYIRPIKQTSSDSTMTKYNKNKKQKILYKLKKKKKL